MDGDYDTDVATAAVAAQKTEDASLLGRSMVFRMLQRVRKVLDRDGLIGTCRASRRYRSAYNLGLLWIALEPIIWGVEVGITTVAKDANQAMMSIDLSPRDPYPFFHPILHRLPALTLRLPLLLWIIAEAHLGVVHWILEWLSLEETERARRKVKEAQRKVDEAQQRLQEVRDGKRTENASAPLFSTLVSWRLFRFAFYAAFLWDVCVTPARVSTFVAKVLAEHSDWVIGVTPADLVAYNPWRDHLPGQDAVLRECKFFHPQDRGSLE
jgi:hypothetical protein